MFERSLSSQPSSSLHTPPSHHPAFRRERVEPSPLAEGSVELHTHQALGLQVLVHRVKDPNKSFCVSFRTPHDSANGLPHILEHLALAGSKEFPFKDPFFTTRRGSFNTYMNASTGQEITNYPFATTNATELLNLARIYLDAVFHPLLTDTAFAREGWRVERSKEGQWEFSGVVYNEMKGAYSDPTRFLFRATCAALYWDTSRGKDSGGDPRQIPSLTREELLRFHKAHYHPSGAKIVIHGDMSDSELREIFALIEEKVSGFERSEFTPYTATHTSTPRHQCVDLEFPADPKKKAGEPLALVAWPLGQITDPTDRVLWDVLEGALLNGEAAPLRRGLIERGLATSLVMSGTVMSTADAIFLVGGTDVPREDSKRFTEGVREILQEVVRDGFSREAIEAVLNEYAFQLQEGPISTPRGVQLALGIGPDWLRGEDPISAMDLRTRLRAVGERLSVEQDLLTDLIRDRILANPESVTVIVRPSHEAYTRAAEQESARVKAYVAALDAAAVNSIEELNTRMIAEMDDPTELDQIPALNLADLPPSLDRFDVVSDRDQHGPISRGVVPSKGIVYSTLAFDVSSLPDRLLLYTPLVSTLLGNHDTNRPLVQFEQDVRSRTGGISFAVTADFDHASKQEKILFIATGAALDERSPDLFELMREGLLETRIDRTRIRELLSEKISNLERGLARDGHSAASTAAQKAVSPHYSRVSLLGGFTQLHFLQQLRDRFDTDWTQIEAELNHVKSALINRDNARAVLHCEGARRDAHTALLEGLLAQVPQGISLPQYEPLIFTPGERILGLPVNSDVAYIGTAQQLPIDSNPELRGAMLVLSQAITYNYLLPEIRGNSGAYGTGASFRPSTGIFGAYTYRSKKDNILADIATIEGIPEFLRTLRISPSELEKLIIGTASNIAQYQHPFLASLDDLQSRLMGRTRDRIERVYLQIVSCTPAHLEQAAEIVRSATTPPCIRVVSSESVLRQLGIPIKSDKEQ